MSIDIEHQLIELTCDPKLKQMFIETSFEIFCTLINGNLRKISS